MSGPFLLIAAFSGRAAGMAARRAGLMPLVADLFADADLCAAAAGVRRAAGDVERGFEADALLTALCELAAGAAEPPLGVVYGAGFEDRPELLARIAKRWPLLGNTAETVEAVKDPQRLAETFADLGISHPDIRSADADAAPGWLLKRRGGAGGGHVRRDQALPAGVLSSDPGRLRPDAYWQRYVRGRQVSALFLCGAHGTEIVGFSEQWTAPGPGQPFRFGGAVCPAELPHGLASALGEAIRKTAAAFSLRGLNSADFIIGTQDWWLIEINPRLGATLDIFDTAEGWLMNAHLAALRGEPVAGIGQAASARAMQIVYAESAIRVPDTSWPEWCADRPHPDERMPAHAPLCTILAAADSPREARRLCRERSQRIYKLMGVECRTA